VIAGGSRDSYTLHQFKPDNHLFLFAKSYTEIFLQIKICHTIYINSVVCFFLIIISITVVKVKQDANNNINAYSQDKNITQLNIK